MKSRIWTLPLLLLTASCSEAHYDTRDTRSLVYPDVKEYSREAQDGIRSELKANGCLPGGIGYPDCKTPGLFGIAVDYWKMREQTRAALAADSQQ